MKRLSRILLAFAAVFVSLPALAQASSPSLSFDSIQVSPSANSAAVLSLRICNSAGEPVSLQLEAHNTAIHTFYRRNFLLKDVGRSQQSMELPRSFSAMAQPGDEVKVSPKQIKGSQSGTPIDSPKPVQAFFGQVPAPLPSAPSPSAPKPGSKAQAKPCLSTLQEGAHTLCLGALATHASGLRIKFEQWNNDQAYLKVRRFRWGGEQEVRLQEGESKTIYTWAKPYRRLRMTLEKGLSQGQIQLRLERLY